MVMYGHVWSCMVMYGNGHISSHMVKNHEDAYQPKNLTLFTVEYDHYLRQKKQKLWGNLASMVYFHVGGVL